MKQNITLYCTIRFAAYICCQKLIQAKTSKNRIFRAVKLLYIDDDDDIMMMMIVMIIITIVKVKDDSIIRMTYPRLSDIHSSM